MRGLSGLDVAREVRLVRPDLPVLIASGFIDEQLRSEAAAAGVRELVFKASAVGDFCATVQRFLRPHEPEPSPLAGSLSPAPTGHP